MNFHTDSHSIPCTGFASSLHYLLSQDRNQLFTLLTQNFWVSMLSLWLLFTPLSPFTLIDLRTLKGFEPSSVSTHRPISHWKYSVIYLSLSWVSLYSAVGNSEFNLSKSRIPIKPYKQDILASLSVSFQDCGGLTLAVDSGGRGESRTRRTVTFRHFSKVFPYR